MDNSVLPLTKLDAVNICLAAIGETKVNSIEDAGIDAQQAADLIDETSRVVQDRGWVWNKERPTLAPDADGNIFLPINVSKVETRDESQDTYVVQRGRKLYDTEHGTYKFTIPLKVEMLVRLPWDELPSAAQNFITYSSAVTLQGRLLGADAVDKRLENTSKKAWAELIRAEIQAGNFNMNRDNWSSASALNRGMFKRAMYL